MSVPRVERFDQIGPNRVQVNAVSGVRRQRIACRDDAHLARLFAAENRRNGNAVNHREIGEIENRGHYQNLTFSGAFIARGAPILLGGMARTGPHIDATPTINTPRAPFVT
ncbi:hypothetical protein [Mycolicibacterium mageritense]|uniref:hypothetical protein n=1 Tax=Mycolicibacterium mageritense TaxID=53462 RepID=UPI0013D18338|nr:hypothetical protein [Mycolicibacterium mageritense]